MPDPEKLIPAHGGYRNLKSFQVAAGLRREDARRADPIARRPANADAVAQWAKDVRGGRSGLGGPSGQEKAPDASIRSTPSTMSTYPEIAANGVLAPSSLLKRQLASLEKAFVAGGGFTERLYRVGSQRRNRG